MIGAVFSGAVRSGGRLWRGRRHAGRIGGAGERFPASTPANGGFAFSFQLAVGIVVMLPLLGGLIIEQTRLDRRRIAESEQRFRRAMEDSAIGVVVVALDGRIVESNPSFAAMLGYSRAELETLTFFQITHPDDVANRP